MSVKIRLKRVGARNHPVYRIVVADSRSPRDGKCIEELGTYHPQKAGHNFTLNLERANYWIAHGAQPSDTVSSFIKKAEKGIPETESTASSTTPAAPTPTPEPAPAAAETPAAPAATATASAGADTAEPAEKPAAEAAAPAPAEAEEKKETEVKADSEGTA